MSKDIDKNVQDTLWKLVGMMLSCFATFILAVVKITVEVIFYSATFLVWALTPVRAWLDTTCDDFEEKVKNHKVVESHHGPTI